MSSLRMSLLNPLQPNDQLGSNSNSDKEASNEWEESTFLKLVQINPEMYRFMVLMGMVRVDKDFIYCGISKSFVLFWNYFLFIVLLLYVLPQIGEAFAVLFSWHLDDASINFTWVAFLTIQVIVIWFGVFYLRRAICEKQLMNRQWYLTAFDYCLPICRYVLVTVVVFTLLCLAFYVDFCLTSFDSEQLINTLALVIVGVQILATISGSCYLVGSLFVLMVEQRISLMSMQQLVQQVRDRTITHNSYFATRNLIKSREERLPINIVVFAALLNTLLGVILLLLYITLTDFQGVVYWVFTVFLELSAFGRELIILLVLLCEISQVNDQAQLMIQLLAETEWSKNKMKSTSVVVVAVDDHQAELRRYSVFMACVGKPIGSTIFYKKPTRNHIILQIGSSVLVTLLAVIKAYFKAKM